MFSRLFETNDRSSKKQLWNLKSLSPSRQKTLNSSQPFIMNSGMLSGNKKNSSLQRKSEKLNVQIDGQKLLLQRPTGKFYKINGLEKSPVRIKSELKKQIQLISQGDFISAKETPTTYASRSPGRKNMLADFLGKTNRAANLKKNTKSKANTKVFIKPGFEFSKRKSSPKFKKEKSALDITNAKLKEQFERLSQDLFKQARANNNLFLNKFYKDFANLSSTAKKRMNFSITDSEGCTIAHYSVWNGNIQLFNFLLSVKMNFETTNNSGITPLMLAALKGHKKMASILSKIVTEINKQDNAGNTSLHYAVVKERLDIVEILLERMDIDPYVLNNDGERCLDLTHPTNAIKLKEILLRFDNRKGIGRRDVEILAESKMLSTPLSVDKSTFKRTDSTKFESCNTSNSKSIDLNNFIIHSLLGKGSFGDVYLIEKKDNNILYAMKVLNKQKVFNDNLKRYAITERNVLSAIDHPFVVKLRYAFQNSEYLFLIMDYYPGGDLGTYLMDEGTFTEKKAKIYIAEIVLALEELHKNDIIFRDLKPENVMVDAEGHVALIDFGLSKERVVHNDTGAKSFCGSVAYLAPEMIRKLGHGKAIDWYLLGVVLYEMLFGVPPFYADTKEELFHNIEHEKLQLPSDCPKPLRDILHGLLEKDASKRLGTIKGVQEIKSHPWFFDIDWKIVLDRKLKPPRPRIRKLKLFDNIGDELIGSGKTDRQAINGWTFIENKLAD